ncbi:MAG: hypothetical protein WBN83_09375 [Desulfoprunum sp.]|jgi:hypothetical protein|uniref:hypothetical protein n=1 Tax=Desulfoprunum sp. TaxID=2020866 RepID=UPI00052D7097|nr:hypothetical protein JT06_16545 [Desulfobulbus sp. Tol-SR]
MNLHYTADIQAGAVFEIFGNRVNIFFADFQRFRSGGYLLNQDGLCFLRYRTQISFSHMVDNLNHSTLLLVVYFGHARTELVSYLTVYTLIVKKTFSKQPQRKIIDRIDRRRRLIILERQMPYRDAKKK